MLEDERPASEVEAAIESGQAVMSWINLGEVYYTVARRRDVEAAAIALAAIERSLVLEEPGASLVRAAAAIKARHPISYADAFAVATAEKHGLPLMTGDPELVELEREHLEVVDLR